MPLFRPKLTALLALVALPLVAQSHQEDSMTTGLWPNSVPVYVDPSPVHPVPTGTISAELLRYPLPAKALAMLRKALQTSQAGDPARAVKQLQQTLSKYPDTGAWVYSLLGVEYLRMEQIPEAVDTLEKSVKLLPHDASNHANLGLALVSSGQYDRAQLELRRALELDPHYAMASQLLRALTPNETAKK